MKNVFRWAPIYLAIATTSGCGSSTPPPNSPATASAKPSAQDDANDPKRPGYIRLISAGDGERHALRYHYEAGKHAVLAMTMRMKMSMQVGQNSPPETPLPPIKSTMTIDTETVSPEGDVTYAFRMVSTEVVPTEGVAPQVAKAMATEMEKIVGLSGRATVTPRGLTKDSSFEVPPGAGPQVAELLENLQQQLQQMAAPFPEEPVGVNAVWERISPLKTRALTLNQKVTYTLKKSAPDHADIDLALEQTAPPQELHNQKLPPGATAKLESFTSTGTGSMSLPLDTLVPKSQMKTQSLFAMSVESKGETLPLKMKMGLDIDLLDSTPKAR